MAVADYLVDTSALARLRLPEIAAVLEPLVDAGRTGICGMGALEVGFGARNLADHLEMRAGIGTHEWVPTEDVDFARAFEVQAELARTGRHRAVSLPDLLAGAVAERNRMTLLHYDADFDLLTEITGQSTRWIVPRGSID